MAQPVISFGLSTVDKGESIPLKDVSVRARIQGYLVGVASTLRYANDSEDPLEVVFRFPVDDSWAVVGLEATIGGRTVKGVVREKEEARQMYDDALASGFSAALGEEKAGDIFSITLGNLPPKDTAEVRLRLVGELPVDAEGGVRFSLPTVLKPRYTPAGSTDPLAPVGSGSEGDQITSASSPSVFSFSLEVADEEGVAGVESPTHSVSCERRGGKVQVSLGDGGSLKEDLVIQVHYKEPHQPKAICEGGVGEGDLMGSPVVMLNFFPKFETTQAACEFIFLIDRSGSMQGSFIESARDTLTLFLKSLSPGCYFNILGFGSRFEHLFPQSVPYNQENLDTAVAHSESLQADLGGTELLSPLQHIFKQKLLSGLPRQVFVLTDGSVSNTAACIDEAKKNVRKARCFTFGIGSGASTALVKGLAKAGNGTAEFVQHGERLQPKVIRSLKRAMQPSCTDVQLSCQPAQGVMWAPETLPAIFNGDRFIVYGILKNPAGGQSAASGTITLRYKVLGEQIQHQIPIPPSTDTGAAEDAIPIIHHLAAKSLLQDWQTGGGLEGLTESDQKQKIIRLSIESSVVSYFTAYIAIQEQGEPVEGALKTWDVKALLAERDMRVRYGLIGGGQERFRSLSSSMNRMYFSAPGAVLSSSGYGASRAITLDSATYGAPKSAACCGGGGGGGGGSSYRQSRSSAAPTPVSLPKKAEPTPPSTTPASASPAQKQANLITLQQADGSWALDAALASILGRSVPELEAGCPVRCEGDMRTIWATVLAVVYLETRHGAQRDEWELVAMKAESWLQGHSPPDLQQLKDTAKQFISS